MRLIPVSAASRADLFRVIRPDPSSPRLDRLAKKRLPRSSKKAASTAMGNENPPSGLAVALDQRGVVRMCSDVAMARDLNRCMGALDRRLSIELDSSACSHFCDGLGC